MSGPQEDRVLTITSEDLQQLIQDTIVDTTEHHKSLPSTNDQGILRARQQNEFTPKTIHLIYAEKQTQGRGRGANAWESASGSLTFSLIAPQTNALSPVASLHLAVATAKACAPFASHTAMKVKWPNDIYLDQQKIGGILIEAPSATGYWVVGVGINVNNQITAETGLVGQATSLRAEMKSTVDRCDVLRQILIRFGDIWRAPDALTVPPTDWSQWCLLSGKQLSLDTEQQTRTGICRGIDKYGNLLLEARSQDDGKPQCHAFASATNIQWQ